MRDAPAHQADRSGGADRGGHPNGRLMTAEEVAHLLGVTPGWVYEQSRAGRIPTVTLGRYRRYRRAAIELWIEDLERAARQRTNSRGAKAADAAA